MSCDTPDDHPAVETWSPGQGVHLTTRRECCRPDPFPADGVYPMHPGPVDVTDTDH